GVLAWHLAAPLIQSGAGPTDNLTWGVAFYGALPWPVQAIGVILVLAALVWTFKSPESRVQSPKSDQWQRLWTLDSGLWTWLLVGLVALALAVFPVQHSEGDSSEFDAKIPKGAIWRERELLDFYTKARL